MSQRIVVTGTETVSDKIVNFQTNIEYPFSDVSVAFSPVQDLHGYDNPWPPGGGKNLFNYDLATFSPAHPYGLSITRDGDLVNVSGTSTNASKTSLQFAVTTTYANGDLSGKGYVCQAMDVTGTHTINSAWGFRTASEKAFAISVANVEPHSVVNISFRISVAASSQAAWSPYSNVCPISGWSEATVTRTGANIFDGEVESGYYYTSSGRPASSNAAYRTKNPISVLPETTYYLLPSPHSISSGKPTRLFFYKSDGTFISSPSGASRPRSFTTPAECEQLKFFVNEAIENYDQIMVSFGTTAPSAWSAYSGTTYTIDLNGTRYGGTVDFVSGLMTLTKYFKSYSRVDGRSENEKGYFWYSTAGAIGIPVIAATSSGLLANRFKAVSNVHEGRPEGEMAFFANGIIRWKEQGSLSIADYRTYLASNPIEICYDLATPIEVQLTPTQVQTLIETNNVWSNANGDTTVTYSDGYYIDYISKIIYGDKIILDLTSDTITEPKLLTGYTAHRADGEYIEGSLPWRTVVQETLLYLDRASISQQTLNTDGSVTGTTLIL